MRARTDEAPDAVEAARLNAEAAQDLAARIKNAPRPTGCATTLQPGQLCSVCWTTHQEKAA